VRYVYLPSAVIVVCADEAALSVTSAVKFDKVVAESKQAKHDKYV